MFQKIKRLALASVAGFVLALSIGWLPGELGAVYNQYQATKYNDVTVANLLVRDTGLYDSGGTVRLKLGSTSEFSTGQLGMGVVGTVISTAVTSGNSYGQSVSCYLSGAVAAVEGSLLISTTPVAGQGCSVAVSLAVAAQTNVVGIAKSAVSTGSVVNVYYDGFVLALTTGPVSAGDVLVSTTGAAGYLCAQNAPTTGTDIGVAMAGGISAGGRTLIRLR